MFLDVCVMFTISVNRTKLDPRARIGMFLMFKPNVKDCIVSYLNSHCIHISRNVIFYEDKFHFKTISQENSIDKMITPVFEKIKDYDFDLTVHKSKNLNDNIDSENHITHAQNIDDPDNLNKSDSIDTEQAFDSASEQNCPRRSTRHNNVPAYLQDFQSSFTKTEKKTRYCIKGHVSMARLSSFK